MKYKAFIILAALSSSLLLFSQCSSEPMVDLTVNEAEKKVDVMVDGKLFTSYIYPDVIKKPVLWPVIFLPEQATVEYGVELGQSG